MKGCHKDLSETKRLEILDKLVNKDGYNTVRLRLQALQNVTTDAKTRQVTGEDMVYLRKKNRGS